MRSRKITVLNTDFPLPRQLKELFYYERARIYPIGRNWTSRVFFKFLGTPEKDKSKNRVKVLLRKVPIYSKAISAARMRDNDRITQELRQNSFTYTDKGDRKACKEFARTQNFRLRQREEIASKYYKLFLTKQKYG